MNLNKVEELGVEIEEEGQGIYQLFHSIAHNLNLHEFVVGTRRNVTVRVKTRPSYTSIVRGRMNDIGCRIQDLVQEDFYFAVDTFYIDGLANTALYLLRDKEEFDDLSDEDPAEFHRRSGELFGYPECCVENFIQVLREEDALNHERTQSKVVMKNYREKTDEYPFGFNEKTFEDSGSVLPYVPCSPECEESHRIAEERGKIAQKVEQRLEKEQQKLLGDDSA